MVFLELGLNIAVAVLLACTIAYCWRLERRIRVLQDGRGELARLLKHFDESTRRASESIANLQTANRKLGETIQARIDKANFVADDLMFLVERAVKLTDELEAGLAARRAADAALTTGTLRAARPPAPVAPKPAAPKPVVPTSPKGMDPKAVLEALANRSTSDPSLRGQRAGSAAAERLPRSRNEQELLELIKSGQF